MYVDCLLIPGIRPARNEAINLGSEPGPSGIILVLVRLMGSRVKSKFGLKPFVVINGCSKY